MGLDCECNINASILSLVALHRRRRLFNLPRRRFNDLGERLWYNTMRRVLYKHHAAMVAIVECVQYILCGLYVGHAECGAASAAESKIERSIRQH